MTSYDQNNIFARILRKELPASIVYEDDVTLAFHDVHPHAPVHVLVIPKGPYVSYSDFIQNAPHEMIIGMTQAVLKVVDLCSLAEQGFRLVVNQGAHGGQEVPHYHIHVLGGAPLPRLAP